MNVREDKMTYQFGLKIILVLCVPVLFRIISREKREYMKMKNTELSNVHITNFGGKTASAI